jgi:DNA-binding transcriptional MerR regulator
MSRGYEGAGVRIGELAKRSGLTATRIRFYESAGLIKGVERQANGYRDYGPEALWVLEIIAGAQSAGFSLEEIRQLLPGGHDTWDHADLLEGLRRKVAEIEALQARLEQSKEQLLVAIESVKNVPEDLVCADRTQWVLERVRQEGQVPAKQRGSAKSRADAMKRVRGA